MKRLRLLTRIIRSTHADALLSSLIVLIFGIAGVLAVIEPNIHSYGDALWYCFSVITTIGFGDITATTPVGRILSIVLGLGGILTTGIVVGVVVAYYNEFLRMRQNESLEAFAEKLEHLSDLSPEELEELSRKARALHTSSRRTSIQTGSVEHD